MSLAVQDKKSVSDGEELLVAMFRLLQVVKIHQSNNKLFPENVEYFRSALQKLWTGGRVAEFALFRGRFYLNDERIVYSASMWNTVIKITEFFQEREINGLKFFPIASPTDSTIIRLMDVLNRAKRESEPYKWLTENLTEDLDWVKVTCEGDESALGSGDDGGSAQGRQAVVRTNLAQELGQAARRTYSQALTVMRNILQRLEEKKKIGVQKAKRSVQELTDILFEDEAAFLALSTVRDGCDAIFTHSVNTAILSIGLGYRLGVGREGLEQLGLAGLVHDIGKIGAPSRVASHPGRLEGQRLAQAQSHVLGSLYQIVRLNATYALKLALLRSTQEHHLGMDGTGYPRRKGQMPLSLHGRILALTDQYVAMTSARPWRSEMSPFDALMNLLDQAGTKLDPAVVKAFINFLGPWPVGSLLVLDTRELAISKYTPPDSPEGWPVVRLLVMGADNVPKKGEEVDLGEKNPDGSQKRKVISCLHPSLYGIQPVDFLLEE
ncbi:MAG: HD domain-containing protein [Deltaproteobacteria bacterium]|nr:HD domain-containing protein [Deltaproteobacteria bacterium]